MPVADTERSLYEPVAAWAERTLGCFATGTDKGLRHGRIDVIGLRDSGGRLSGRTEVISLEVKRGTQPFATSIGQASGYSIYADRCYLAEYRPRGFTDDEKVIAQRLDVGLIQISGTQRIRIREVLSAPLREPLEGLRLEVIEKLQYSLCNVCGSLFRSGDVREGKARPFSRVVRQNDAGTQMSRAANQERGVVYWLWEQADRSRADAGKQLYYHRRYVCPDCVQALFAQGSDPA